MRRGEIPHDIINRAWEVYADFTYRQNGCPIGVTDKLHWISGFSTALAVITGGMDVGIPQGTPSVDVIRQLIYKELPEFKGQLDAAVVIAKEKGLGQ
jgi:hypothetical protein